MKLSRQFGTLYLMSAPLQWDLCKTHRKMKMEQAKEYGLQFDSSDFYYADKLLLTDPKTSRNYVVSKSITSNLELLKIKEYNWTFFAPYLHAGEKRTYLLPDNSLVISVLDEAEGESLLRFVHIYPDGPMTDRFFTCYDMGLVDMKTGEKHGVIKPELEQYLYKLFCFIYLSENEEIFVASKAKHGSSKDPNNLLNDTPFPVTILNSRWKKTAVRTEGFLVRGHYGLRRYGTGRSMARVVFIEPYEKKGYTRTYKEA